MLRKQTGNMYSFVTHTWNPIKGQCMHQCPYCYMRRFPLNPVHIHKGELMTKLGTGNTIFVCSGTDMFAPDVPSCWITAVLKKCHTSFGNTFLFQSKDPARMLAYADTLPPGSIVGTTIESDTWFPEYMGFAPDIRSRAIAMKIFREKGFRTMITIEPIMSFGLKGLVSMMQDIKPEWINIGADSKHSGLPEPTYSEIKSLIRSLELAGIKVIEKSNLKRLQEVPNV